MIRVQDLFFNTLSEGEMVTFGKIGNIAWNHKPTFLGFKDWKNILRRFGDYTLIKNKLTDSIDGTGW